MLDITDEFNAMREKKKKNYNKYDHKSSKAMPVTQAEWDRLHPNHSVLVIPDHPGADHSWDSTSSFQPGTARRPRIIKTRDSIGNLSSIVFPAIAIFGCLLGIIIWAMMGLS